MVATHTDRRGPAFVLLLVAAGLIGAPPSHAQLAGRGGEFEDLGFTSTTAVSARAAGLAGIVAATGDVTALVYNPAGLCRIKQRSPLLGFSHDTRETITGYDAGSSGLSSDRTGLLFAGAAYPIPVFRGSLVPAVAVHRIFVSDLDISYEAGNTNAPRMDAFRLEQSGASYAFSFGFGVDLASVLSAGLSMSVFEGGYDALQQSHTRTPGPPGAIDRYVVNEIDGDLDGMLGRVGVTFFVHRHLHVAVCAATPTLVNHATRETGEITEVIENNTGSTVPTAAETSTEYILPYRLDGAIEIPWGAWLAVVQAGTCDWTQAAIDQARLRLQNGDTVLQRTLELRAGLEWTASRWPVRLRAGVARLPFALRYVQADRIDNDRLEPVDQESSPLRFSLGAGVALKRTILIDAAFTHTHGDRSTASFSEERTWSQFVIEGSYWF